MKKLFNNRIVNGIFFFLFGVISLHLYQKYLSRVKVSIDRTEIKNINPLFDQFYNDDFFNTSNDPFESMRKMREQMEKQFDSPHTGSGIFDSWFEKRFGGGNVEEITKREDNDFVYYDVKVSGLDQDKVKVSVSNGLISISGKTEKKSDAGNTSNYYSSTFNRSFPLPPNVEETKVQMEQEKDKVIIKFPKTKRSGQ